MFNPVWYRTCDIRDYLSGKVDDIVLSCDFAIDLEPMRSYLFSTSLEVDICWIFCRIYMIWSLETFVM